MRHFPKQGLYDPRAEHDSCGVGFVADIRGGASHAVIERAMTVLANLQHRGATGANPTTGDGAGVLVQMPDAFLRRAFAGKDDKVQLPPPGRYGVAMLFMPQGDAAFVAAKECAEKVITGEGLQVLAWREVPVCRSAINDEVAKTAPRIMQLAVQPDVGAGLPADKFERKLYAARRLMERQCAKFAEDDNAGFYCASFSARTIVYKGMFLAPQLPAYYPDLHDAHFASALAVVHQRFSTNTFPAWSLAHPYRCIAHNGEINTLRGNINNMTARHHILSSPAFGGDLEKLWPLIEDGQSDTATLDNVAELLMLSGYSPARAMATLIPEAWQQHKTMPPNLREFYHYHAPMMEPWDGPAGVVFTNGLQIGAILDRNGLRPGRYWLTRDNWIIMASEAGVLDIPDNNIARKWRIQPGKMLLVDIANRCIVGDDEVKEQLASSHPYHHWREQSQKTLESLPPGREDRGARIRGDALLRAQQSFGYTQEDIKFILHPMTQTSAEPIGAMGDDAPPAALSQRRKPLSAYFRQEFAQVTNPAIDPIREELVMSLKSYLGARPNLLSPNEAPRRRCLEAEHPVLLPEEFAKVRALKSARLLDVVYPAAEGADGLAKALDVLCAKASAAVREGAEVLILSDRQMSAENVAVPMLLAVSAVHHHLVNEGDRALVGLVLDTGAAREVHDFAVLAGFGAEAVYPYLAYATVGGFADIGGAEKNMHSYRAAVGKGLLKVMSKMGVSTFQSYCGAQIFEIVGLSSALVNQYFCNTVSQIEGAGIADIAEDALYWHGVAYGKDYQPLYENELDTGGDYAVRERGEKHLWSPMSVAKLQRAARAKSVSDYEEYSRLINESALMTLRGMLDIAAAKQPIDINEVEAAADIVRRFSTGAMSFGSISREAHTTLAIAMNRIGGKSNTGEGGEESARFVPLDNGDSMRSAIKQVASGRFGVTAEYLANAKMMQIKIAQGAKPGEGGQLPGHKVDDAIAAVRHSVPGVGLISPPPHHDIYSIEDIAQLIYDLKCANPNGDVSVKLVSRFGVGTVAAGVAKAKADHITIAGHDGGTGASPLSSIKRAGTPWELGLSETHQTLVINNLRGRIALQVDGQIKTGRDVVIGAMLGADEFGFATAPLVAQGCIMMRKCHLNTCPVGIATQDKRLRARFAGKPEHIVNYFFFVAEEVRRLLAHCGFRKLDDIIGRADLLTPRKAIKGRAAKLKLDAVLHMPKTNDNRARHNCERQTHALANAPDVRWLPKAKKAMTSGKPVVINDKTNTTERAAGAMVSNEIARRFGHKGLPEGLITIKLRGVCGQSFGAFASNGMTMLAEGEANDYVGKGLSGGILGIYPPKSKRKDGSNIIIGNTALYGAVCGACFGRGVAGERFAVRNSGASAVIEGAGDHCCEYMTGGTVVVLGAVGRNFAAGMSGGIAYVLDEAKNFAAHCNTTMVSVGKLGDAAGEAQHLKRADTDIVRALLKKHLHYTGSPKAKLILEDWQQWRNKFVKITPHEYARALMEMARKKAA
ncbi:MAG: glutamate synthase large subunit, partial [Gammaproteobacteria bacterium]